MGIEEDSINPIISFLHKLLGNNLWILPVSIAIASWCIFYFHQDKWIILYIAIICSLIAILHIFSRIFMWIRNMFIRLQSDVKTREAAAKRAKQAQADNERKNREHADTIWKLVGHLDTDLIWATTLFLSLEIHDDDKLIRFVKIPKDHFSDEGKHYHLYFEIIQKLTFSNGYGSSFKLINEERVNDIMYFYIEPYFFKLIENFQSTQKWIKV